MSVSKNIVWYLVASTALSPLLIAVAGGQTPGSQPAKNVWSSLRANTARSSSSKPGGLADLDRELAATAENAAPQVSGGPALAAPRASVSNGLSKPAPAGLNPSGPRPGVPALPFRAPSIPSTFRSPGYVSLSSASTPAQLRPPVVPSRHASLRNKSSRLQAAIKRARSPKTNPPNTNPKTNQPVYRLSEAAPASAAWRPMSAAKTVSTTARATTSLGSQVSSRSKPVRTPRLLSSGSASPRVASHPRRRIISNTIEEVGPTWIGSEQPWDVIYEDAYFENSGGPSFGLLPSRRRGLFVGAEYLLIRPHFSEARAFSRRDLAVPNSNPSIQTETTIDFEFGYESSLRTYVGYRLDDCCSEFRATYSRLRGRSNLSGAAVTGTGTMGAVQFTAFEINALANGQTITASTDVTGDVYDFEISRCIRSRSDCGSCGDCGDGGCGSGGCGDGGCGSCGGCSTCPAWDLTWSAGVRIADMGYDSLVSGPTTGGTGTIDAHMNFVGAGPIIGLAGNRHFGRAQKFSVYADWNLALLLGHYDHTLTRTNNQPTVTNITRFDADLTRVIPVTEIELGVRWRPRPRLTVSAGWFMQVWWDLGMTEEEASSFDNLNFLRDDSNIMSWDGLSVRAELMF
jgi:hypothetical protein